MSKESQQLIDSDYMPRESYSIVESCKYLTFKDHPACQAIYFTVINYK